MKEFFDKMTDDEIKYLGSSYTPLMLFLVPTSVLILLAFVIEGIRYFF